MSIRFHHYETTAALARRNVYFNHVYTSQMKDDETDSVVLTLVVVTYNHNDQSRCLGVFSSQLSRKQNSLCITALRLNKICHKQRTDFDHEDSPRHTHASFDDEENQGWIGCFGAIGYSRSCGRNSQETD